MAEQKRLIFVEPLFREEGRLPIPPIFRFWAELPIKRLIEGYGGIARIEGLHELTYCWEVTIDPRYDTNEVWRAVVCMADYINEHGSLIGFGKEE